MQQEVLSRGVGNQSLTNWPPIIAGFMAKGIPESEIMPRENVFTYHAWRALGRQVRRGEHGVKVTTFVPMDKKTSDIDPETGKAKRVPLCRRALAFVVGKALRLPNESHDGVHLVARRVERRSSGEENGHMSVFLLRHRRLCGHCQTWPTNLSPRR
jgi:hypothetical protein